MPHSPSGLESGRVQTQPPSALRTFSQPAPLDPSWAINHSTSSSNGTTSIDSKGQEPRYNAMTPGRLSRTFSMPPHSQLGHLSHPHATMGSPHPPIILPSRSPGTDELSMELADSVQMVIQTLLQTSPPHFLDPTREQLSGCSLQIPTPSISALFTSMKTLNYISRHIHAFSPGKLSSGSSPPTPAQDEFDAGDLLQSVGDLLSGVAAETGVDLVIFHGDPTLKNIPVRSDECALIYTLSYIARQILVTASPGDVLELGLRIFRSERHLDSVDPPPPSPLSMRCVFEFRHKVPRRYAEREASRVGVSLPNLHATTLRTLLEVLKADLTENLAPSTPLWRGKYDLTVPVNEGNPINVADVSQQEEAARQPFSDVQLAREPTVAELATFVKTLRGRKATFYSNSRSAFAQYLTSYLTAWGMDVFHHASDSVVGTSLAGEEIGLNEEDAPDKLDLQDTPLPELIERPSLPITSSETTTGGPSFTIIDDEINVLRTKLTEIHTPFLPTLDNRINKRPSLAAHHRPKSSSAIRRVVPAPVENNGKAAELGVIVHFTSLSNYRAVKDVVHGSLVPNPAKLPEVIVIPKPAGLRRFTTALYTAISRPLVDPLYFSPIATSPMSPGGPVVSPFFSQPSSSPKPAPSPLPPPETTLETITTPSTSGTPTPTQVLPASPLGAESLGYFRKEGNKFAGSASSGLFVKGPDGKTGILFQLSPSPSEYDFGHPNETENTKYPSTLGNSDTVPGHSVSAEGKVVEASTSTKAVPKPLTTDTSDSLSPDSSRTANRSSPPSNQLNIGDVNGMASATNPVFERTPVSVDPPKPIKTSIVGAKAKKKDKVVLPITVLIVEDNPIQRNILATFMKTKQIDYGIAENGLEAVEKWRTGNYHLVLMDIQMPVMDGIEATKQIRQLESAQHRALTTLTPLSEGSQTPNSINSAESRQPSTPFHSSVIIVALTAQASQADRVIALAAGCNDFLTKPVKLLWLEKKIIEWGSIKVLQMWADPEVEPALRKRQQASARAVADNLRIVRSANKVKPSTTTDSNNVI